jgi:hypothetical protein
VKPICLAHVVLAGAAVSGPAFAQPVEVPSFEIGADGGIVGGIGEGLQLGLAAGARLTFNVSQSHSIELAADTLLLDAPRAVYGLFFLQYKHTVRRSEGQRGTRLFYTAGSGGHYRRRKIIERREVRPDGSILVFPAYTTRELSGFNLISVGGGFERVLNRRVAFRAEGGGFVALDEDGFVGFRILAGVSVPVGAYRADVAR